MKLTTGMRLRSQVCDTEVIVVRPADLPGELECGGVPMVERGTDAARGSLDPQHSAGSLLGKRYTLRRAERLELLVTTAGAGSLSVGGEELVVKDAKPLPSSD
jgi:hypothetical protein